MARKVILVTDPGIDSAFAVALALLDPELELVGLLATAGNVPAEQATTNVTVLLEQIDPPRWPRLGAAPPVTYEVDGTRLHGTNGLGGVEFPVARLHHPQPSDKLLAELVRQYAKEISVVLLGPPTVFARALDRDGELPHLINRLVIMGGAWHEPGNATPVAEFHFFCDPPAARKVLQCGAPITLIPLDVSRKAVFSPTDLLNLPSPDAPASQFLRKIVPHAIGATSSLYGVEGFHLKDVVGLMPLTRPEAIKTRTVAVDVETRGELTRGMTVIDSRWDSSAKPNVDLAVSLDTEVVRGYIRQTLGGE